MKQQTLPLNFPQQKTFDNFFAEDNKVLLKNLREITPQSALYLWGESGIGCSHFLQATCQYWQQQSWYTVYLDLRQPSSLNLLLNGAIEGIQLIALDHIEALIGKKTQEELLFHLFNRGLQTPYAMLWGAHSPPEALKCKLADLQSRLKSLLIFNIKNAQDSDKILALQNYAKRRGFKLSDTVAEFLLTHYPRNLPQLIELLDQLDQVTLATHQRLTIPFLKKHLHNFQ